LSQYIYLDFELLARPEFVELLFWWNHTKLNRELLLCHMVYGPQEIISFSFYSGILSSLSRASVQFR